MLILTVVLFVLRIAEIRYFPKHDRISHVNKIVKGGLKWFSRIGIIALVPASFTFLATEPSAVPFQSLETRVKSLEEQYGYLRGEIAAELIEDVEWQIIAKSWDDLSPTDKSTLKLAASLSLQELDTFSKIEYAETRRRTGHEPTTDWTRYLDKGTRTYAARLVALASSGDVNESDIEHVSSADISLLRNATSPQAVPAKLKNEMGDDLFKSVAAYVQDSIISRHGDAQLASFLTGYPLLKEFLDPVVDAMTDTFLPQIKDKANAIARSLLKTDPSFSNEFIGAEISRLYVQSIVRVTRKDIQAHADEQIQAERTQLNNLQSNLLVLVLPQSLDDFDKEYKDPSLRKKGFDPATEDPDTHPKDIEAP